MCGGVVAASSALAALQCNYCSGTVRETKCGSLLQFQLFHPVGECQLFHPVGECQLFHPAVGGI